MPGIKRNDQCFHRGSPGSPDVHVVTGRHRGPEQRCRYHSPRRPDPWQVSKNLPVLKTFRHARLMMRRRDRRRQETIDDIKDTARSQLVGAGPAGISMRAIARHPAITASAVHYYLPSRQALLDALIIDGFTSLAGALRTAYEGAGPRPPGEQWLAVCRAHRAWALDHQAEYLLLYGHDGACAVKQGNPQVDQAYSSAVNVLFSIMRGPSPPMRSTPNASKRPHRHPCAGSCHLARRERRGRRPSRRRPRPGGVYSPTLGNTAAKSRRAACSAGPPRQPGSTTQPSRRQAPAASCRPTRPRSRILRAASAVGAMRCTAIFGAVTGPGQNVLAGPGGPEIITRLASAGLSPVGKRRPGQIPGRILGTWAGSSGQSSARS